MHESDGAKRVVDCHVGHQQRGLQMVRVWVPEEDAEKIREVAQDMRLNRDKPLPIDTWGDWVWVRVAGRNSTEDSEQDADLRQRFSRLRSRRVGDEFWRVRESWVAELGIEDRLVSDPEDGGV